MRIPSIHLSRFIPAYAKSQVRAALLTVVICIAVILILEVDVYSAHFLLTVAGIVGGAACLIYAPPSLLWPMLGVSAVGGVAVYLADLSNTARSNTALIAALLIGGFMWIAGCIERSENRIHARIDKFEGDLEQIQNAIDEERLWKD